MRNMQMQSLGLAVLLTGAVSAGGARAQNTPTSKQNQAQQEAQMQTEWTARLNRIAPGDWRSARGEVGTFAGLTPGKALRMLRALWPTLTVTTVKEELVNSFVNAEHPDTLGVLALAAGDTEEKLRAQNIFVICRTLLLPLHTPEKDVLERLRGYGNKPLATVQRERLREIALQIGAADEATLETLTRPLADVGRSGRMREIAAKSGLLTSCEHRLTDPQTTPKAKASLLEIMDNLDLSPATLAQVLLPVATNAQDDATQYKAFQLLAKAGYAPAYTPLLHAVTKAQSQNNAFMSVLAEALAQYGRPEAIPTLIGLIAADNSYDTVYNIGYFGLGALTGATYDSHHDGNWWKLWWERNRSNLPENVRNLPIPTFPRAKTYQEPLPREVHLDPQRYKQVLLQELAQNASSSHAAQALAGMRDPKVIPTLIGLIAADNTTDSLYHIGYFALSPLAGVPHTPTHDGNWWKLWWEQHHNELPSDVRNLAIPDLPRTPAYREPLPLAMQRDPAVLRIHLLAVLKQQIAAQKPDSDIYHTVDALTALKDPNAIAPLIDLLPPKLDDNSKGLFYNLGFYGLAPLTKARYTSEQDRAWWQQWWAEHHGEVEKKIAAFAPRPDYAQYAYDPGNNRVANPLVTAAGYEPRIKPKTESGAQAAPEPDPEDIRDVPSTRIALHKDPNRAYRIVGLNPQQTPLPNGYKLLVVLPGGDGSDDFRWFVRRLKKYAVPNDMLVAQIIAPRWTDWQARELVWPTRPNPFYGMKFPTEQLIEDVITDVRRQTRIAPEQIYALAWSSSGPAVYTALATPRSSLRGAFMAMSVFRPGELPDPALFKGKRLFLYHSPQDFIQIQQARDAEQFARAHGAQAQFREYQGGHGWTGDTYGDIRAGLDWLTEKAK